MSDGGTTYRIDADGNFKQKMEEFAQSQSKVEENFDKQSGQMENIGGQITQMALQWAGVEMAIERANQALESHARLQREGMQHVLSSESAAGQLPQIAGSPADLSQLLAQGEQFARTAGVTPAEGYASINQLANAGMRDQASLFARLRRARLLGDAPMSQVVGDISAVQYNIPDAGGIENALAIPLAAANASTQNLDAVLSGLPEVGAVANTSQIGFSFAELSALTAASMSAAGRPDVGKTNAAGLIEAFIRAGVKPGTSMQQAIGELESRNMSPQEMVKVLGATGARGFAGITSEKGSQAFASALASAQDVGDPAAVLEEKSSMLAETDDRFWLSQRLRTARTDADVHLMKDSLPAMRREIMRESATAIFGDTAGPLVSLAGEAEIQAALLHPTLQAMGTAANIAFEIRKQTRDLAQALTSSRGKAPAKVEEP